MFGQSHVHSADHSTSTSVAPVKEKAHYAAFVCRQLDAHVAFSRTRRSFLANAKLSTSMQAAEKTRITSWCRNLSEKFHASKHSCLFNPTSFKVESKKSNKDNAKQHGQTKQFFVASCGQRFQPGLKHANGRLSFEILSDLKMVRWCIRLTPLTLVCEVITYRLVQFRQSLKKDFSGWRPAIAFPYLFLSHSFLRLTSFLSQRKWPPLCSPVEWSQFFTTAGVLALVIMCQLWSSLTCCCSPQSSQRHFSIVQSHGSPWSIHAHISYGRNHQTYLNLPEIVSEKENCTPKLWNLIL